MSRGFVQDGFPRCTIFTDADVLTAAYQRQPKQGRVTLNPRDQIAVTELHVLQPGVRVRFPVRIHQCVQPKPLNESVDLRWRHRLLLQIHEVYGQTAFLEEALCRPCRVGIPDTEDLNALLHRRNVYFFAGVPCSHGTSSPSPGNGHCLFNKSCCSLTSFDTLFTFW